MKPPSPTMQTTGRSGSATYDIGGLHDFIELVHFLTLAPRSETGAVGQGVTAGNGPFPAAGGNDGNAGCFDEFDEGQLGVGTGHAASGIDDGPARLGNDTGGLSELVRTGHDARNGSRISQPDFLLLYAGLRWEFDEDRTGAAGVHLPVCICRKASNMASGISRGLDACRRHLVTGRTTSRWSAISGTVPRSLPIRPRGIWLAMTRTGD